MLYVTIKNTKSIEFNDIIDIVLEEYSENTKDNILEFFQTADLNGDGSLEFDEFTRILRHVHYDFFTENKHRKLKLIFDNFSELDEDSGDNVITPLNFKQLSNAHNIFTPEGQTIFLEKVKHQGLVDDLDQLREKWGINIKDAIKKGLDQIQNQELNIFCDRLEALILNYSEKNRHKIWLNYKILEGEIERIHSE